MIMSFQTIRIAIDEEKERDIQKGSRVDNLLKENNKDSVLKIDSNNDNKKKNNVEEEFSESISERLQGSNLQDVNLLISAKQRKKFIKKIFNKNEEDYYKFIELVNQLPTWKHASTLMEMFYNRRGIDLYTKEAIELSNLIYLRYYSRDYAYHEGEILKF
jgi:hypothetical protein